MTNTGRWFIIGVTFLISFLAYSSQIFIFWDYLGGLNIECLKVLLLFNICVVMIFWNYYLTSTTDPGRVPEDWYPKENQENIELNRKTRAPRYCKNCSAYKPPRSHHCRTCKRCVLKMDHHCPWTNNCIGYFNYGYFIRFVFWVDVTCIFHFILLIRRTAKMIQDMTYYKSEPSPIELVFLILNYAAVVPVLFSVGILSLYHFYCMLFNTTTIENWEKDKVSTMVRKGKIKEVVFPYDIGVYKNLQSVLGNNPLLWCFPQQVNGTGLSYPIAKDADPTIIWPPKDPTLPPPPSAKPWENYNDGDNIFVTNSLLDNENKRRRNNSSLGRRSNSSNILVQEDGEVKYSKRKIRRNSEGYIVKDITFEEKGYYYNEHNEDKELNSDGSVNYPSSDEYSDDISDDNGYIDENYRENFGEEENYNEYYNSNDEDYYLENSDINYYNRKQHQDQIYSNNKENVDEDNLPIGLIISKKQLEAMNINSNYQVNNNNVMANKINDNIVNDKKDN